MTITQRLRALRRHHCDCTRLRARIAELEAENATLRTPTHITLTAR